LGGATDAFIAKLSPAGATAYLSYFGGSGRETGRAIAVDGAGNIYVGGQTTSTNLPVASAIQENNGTSGACADDTCVDAFFMKLNAAGNQLLFSSYFGGSGEEDATGIAVDSEANLYATGVTFSGDFPTKNAQKNSLAGTSDGFVLKIADVAPSPPRPTPAADAIVNGASFAVGTALAPGSIASVFGSNLAATVDRAAQLPLPTVLADSQSDISERAAPLFYASPAQVNVQIPWESEATPQGTLTVSVRDDDSSPVSFALTTYSPGIFSVDSSGSGQGAILNANTASLAAPADAFPGSRPAQRGDYISIFCTGLGPVAEHPPTGTPASGPTSTTATPAVLVGGASAAVSYSGLAPGFVGLYQVDVQVPFGSVEGDSVPVGLVIGGIASNIVTIAIR
jgi:uncharacterized protein (TIGR03437 family)